MPVKGRKKQFLIATCLVSIVLILDRFTKLFIKENLGVGESIPLIKNIFHITYVRNTGAAFGLFKNSTHFFIIISIIAIVIIASILIKRIKKGELLKDLVLNIGFIMIFSGAFGNLIDRLKMGYVVDFIDVRIWPVFNIADISITIGTCLLIASLLLPNCLKS
ncbi:MAG: signal peptidase II [Candidatus Omnitrophota bacterium]